jgi:hypothetical protein
MQVDQDGSVAQGETKLVVEANEECSDEMMKTTISSGEKEIEANSSPAANHAERIQRLHKQRV